MTNQDRRVGGGRKVGQGFVRNGNIISYRGHGKLNRQHIEPLTLEQGDHFVPTGSINKGTMDEQNIDPRSC
ncbi:hypothetical protein KDH_26610 [Dictyobacter sp. S3.2.2.5]|uniref:Uncharacterized protein n=1 Tax=Dictyobacter halimunensis TaxID=3026934 RepID=A0ABQ6FS17_9CHLR|nr:hypothetical protein KDH_26610 [Dictyobacter sp. S3.2.2.5]